MGVTSKSTLMVVKVEGQEAQMGAVSRALRAHGAALAGAAAP